MEKQKLNVHFSANLIDKKIVEFLSQQYELNLIDISLEELKNIRLKVNEKIKTIDLLIFTGGEDVNPDYYNDEIGKLTHINKKRDGLEFKLLYSDLISSFTLQQKAKLGINNTCPTI